MKNANRKLGVAKNGSKKVRNAWIMHAIDSPTQKHSIEYPKVTHKKYSKLVFLPLKLPLEKWMWPKMGQKRSGGLR